LSHGRSRSRADPLDPARPAAPDPVGPSGAEILVRGGNAIRRRAAARAGACRTADRGAVMAAAAAELDRCSLVKPRRRAAVDRRGGALDVARALGAEKQR